METLIEEIEAGFRQLGGCLTGLIGFYADNKDLDIQVEILRLALQKTEEGADLVSRLHRMNKPGG